MLVIQLKKRNYYPKISELEKKLTDHNHDKYIAIPEFNALAADVFNARLAQANLRAIVCKIQANDESDQIIFFIYVRDFHERKLTKKNFFQKFYSILILWACKATLGNNKVLEICSESQL